jgi:glycine cleavage system transcriptional repressor
VPKRFILSLTAANRTGILAAVTTALAELGGDIEEVSQTVMQKFFTTILAADFPDHRDPQVIESHLAGVCRPFGAQVILKDPQSEQPLELPPGKFERHHLTLTGHDAPGIIAKISGRLARESIDITELYGQRREPDRSFLMVFELAVPVGVDVPALLADLEELGRPFGLEAALAKQAPDAAANEPAVGRFSLKDKAVRGESRGAR